MIILWLVAGYFVLRDYTKRLGKPLVAKPIQVFSLLLAWVGWPLVACWCIASTLFEISFENKTWMNVVNGFFDQDVQPMQEERYKIGFIFRDDTVAIEQKKEIGFRR